MKGFKNIDKLHSLIKTVNYRKILFLAIVELFYKIFNYFDFEFINKIYKMSVLSIFIKKFKKLNKSIQAKSNYIYS